jgi:hypothetical protein
MEAVIGEFVDDIEKNEDTRGQSDGQSEDIDGGIAPVPPKVPECNEDEIPDHELQQLVVIYILTYQ